MVNFRASTRDEIRITKMVHWIFSDFANASPLTTLPQISLISQIPSMSPFLF